MLLEVTLTVAQSSSSQNEKHTCSRNLINSLDYSIIDDQKYIDNLKRFIGETISRYGSIHRHILVDCRATTIHHIRTR